MAGEEKDTRQPFTCTASPHLQGTTKTLDILRSINCTKYMYGDQGDRGREG